MLTHDSKNGVSYTRPYSRNGYDLAGSYDFPLPPLRPGHAYFVGFRAADDAEFSLSSSVSAESLGVLPELDYATGLASFNLAPGAKTTYLVRVPADATRWKHTSTRVGEVELRIENGSLPDTSITTGHYRSTVADSSLNQTLGNYWPWMPDERFYVTFVNTGDTEQPVQFQMNGKTALTDDEDNDGLMDVWERLHFGNTSQDAEDDPDMDGNDNITEQSDGTDPDDATSVLPRLIVTVGGGTVTISPEQTTYAYNDTVTLTATPDAGNVFRGWSGDASGLENPLVITMDRTRRITAGFGIPLAPAVEGEGFVFTTGGDAEWFGQGSVATVDGDAIQSGAIGDNQLTWVETVVTGPGTVKFWWKLSSESGFDYLEFRVDGALQTGRISGEVDWVQYEVTVAEDGDHTLRWTYDKDGSNDRGDDSAWVDGFEWVPAAPQLFDIAMVATGLIGAEALPEATPFNDGVPNLLKYAFNMNLAAADASSMALGGTSGLPTAGLAEDDNGDPVLRVEFVRRKGSGLVYSAVRSSDLAVFTPMVGKVTVVDIDSEWERVTVEEPCDPETVTQCFSRVEVILP